MQRGIIISFLCIMCYFPVHSQSVVVSVTASPAPGTETADTIYYGKTRKLTWADFQGKVRAQSPSAAITFTGFSYQATALQKKDTVQVHVFLQIYFDKKGSWVRPGNKTSYALSHEQLHFDIAKVVADQFKDTLRLSRFSPEYYDSEIHFLYWDFWRKMTAMEMQFDEDTRHGTDHAAESRWADKIRKALLSNSDPD